MKERYSFLFGGPAGTGPNILTQILGGALVVQGYYMYYAGRIFKMLCIEFNILDDILKKLGKRYEENLKEAKQGYEDETKTLCRIISNKRKNDFMNGNQGIATGAINSGLDVYIAYPMTPATSVLNELAE